MIEVKIKILDRKDLNQFGIDPAKVESVELDDDSLSFTMKETVVKTKKPKKKKSKKKVVKHGKKKKSKLVEKFEKGKPKKEDKPKKGSGNISDEQFERAFDSCGGNVKKIFEKLDMKYPTVWARADKLKKVRSKVAKVQASAEEEADSEVAQF